MSIVVALLSAQAAAPAPPPPAAPNFRFECEMFEPADERRSTIFGNVNSEPYGDDASEFTGVRISLQSANPNFAAVTSALVGMPIGIRHRPVVDSDRATGGVSMQSARYFFEFPSFGATSQASRRASLSVRVRDYNSEYGPDFVLTAVGICTLEPLEIAE